MSIFKTVSTTIDPKFMEEDPELGLAPLYKSEQSIKLFCGMIDALAFLSCDEVIDGMDFLHSECLSELMELLTYFDTTYVSRTYHTIKTPGAPDERPTMRFRKVPPLFPPEV